MKKGLSLIILFLFISVLLVGCDFVNITPIGSDYINSFSGEGNSTRMLNIANDEWRMYYKHTGENDFKIGLHDDETIGTLAMRIWSREEAEEWLENENYKKAKYSKTYNFHAFTQEPEEAFDEFELVRDPFYFETVDGVHVNRGYENIYEDGELVRTEMRIQSIRFYHGEGEDLLDDIIVERKGPTRGNYFHPESGKFYISVIADGEWEIRVIGE